jgi:hypothetical protein
MGARGCGCAVAAYIITPAKRGGAVTGDRSWLNGIHHAPRKGAIAEGADIGTAFACWNWGVLFDAEPSAAAKAVGGVAAGRN